MIRSRTAVLFGAFCAFGLLGLLLPAVGASLPAIGEAFAVGIARVGMILAGFQAGYSLFCLLGGVFSDLVGRRPVLIAGTLLYAAGGLLLGRPAGFAGNLGLFVVLGLGGGLIYISSNTLVIELFPERRNSILSFHHLFYAAGTLVGPLLMSLRRGPWSVPYALFGLVSAVLMAFFVLARPPRAVEAPPPAGSLPAHLRARLAEYLDLLSNRLFLLLLAVGLLAIGVQFGVTYMLVALLVQARGVGLPQAGAVLSLYFLAVTAGRLACGWLAARWSNTRLILGSLVLLSGTLLAASLSRGTIALVLFVASGLAFSGLMPSLLALTSTILSQEIMGAALGLIATAAGLGGMLIPSLTSWLAGGVGLNRAFLLIVGTSFVVAGGFALLHGRFLGAERAIHGRSWR